MTTASPTAPQAFTEPQPQPSAPVYPLEKKKPEEKYEVREFEGKRYFKIPVAPTDSVVSLAVRFGLSVSELRQLNPKLSMDYCHFVDFIWIPEESYSDDAVAPREISESDRRIQIKKKFLSMAPACTSKEADFYLDEQGYDLEKAMKQYKEDIAWESSAAAKNSK